MNSILETALTTGSDQVGTVKDKPVLLRQDLPNFFSVFYDGRQCGVRCGDREQAISFALKVANYVSSKS